METLDAVRRTCRLLERAEQEPSLGMLAEVAGLSPSHFQKVFKRHVGVSPKEYAATLRAQRLRQGLAQSGTVTEAIANAGFGSAARVYEKDELGMQPTQFKRGGAGLAIRYATGESSLGPVLVAATARGVCAILFGESEAHLQAQVHARFPKADLAHGDDSFAALVRTVVAFIDTPEKGLDLPLDILGTAFQRRVWKALRAIAPGETITYAELARRIGNPKAVRAAAGACAANKLAVAVPCHRVVGADGSLTGYYWGTVRKQRLLEREAQNKTAE